jgi:nucleotide-binding universal stress UspA family protein
VDVASIHVVGPNDWSLAEIASAVRSALSCVRERVQSVRVEVSRTGDCHVCRLEAHAERGGVVIVECRARLLGEAIESAADGLEDALERRIGASHSRQSTRPRLLLIAGDRDVPGAALHWTAVLGNALEADLDLYRWPARAADRGARATVAQVIRRWHELTMPDASLSERLIPGSPDPIRTAGLLARSRGVQWIVMPAQDGCGAAAMALTRAARCPVLVARAPTTNSVLLLATQPQQDHYPSLKRAARLALPLHAPVLVLHDVSSLPDTAPLMAQVDALAGPWTLLQRECQTRVVGQCLPGIDVLLARGGDRLAAVLEQARKEDAEMIIVSANDGEPCESSARFAEAVANEASSSVLILPGNVVAPALCAPELSPPVAAFSRRPSGARQPLRQLTTKPLTQHAPGPKRERGSLALLPCWPRRRTIGGQRRR